MTTSMNNVWTLKPDRSIITDVAPAMPLCSPGPATPAATPVAPATTLPKIVDLQMLQTLQGNPCL